jgi:hypothetical protein
MAIVDISVYDSIIRARMWDCSSLAAVAARGLDTTAMTSSKRTSAEDVSAPRFGARVGSAK